MSNPAHVLVVEGRFYSRIADELLDGAAAALKQKGATFEVISVPGALEIPQALAAALKHGMFDGSSARGRFRGCVALGCVIRGETSHYGIVAGESARLLLDLAVSHAIPVGNGILTVENEVQALARSSVSGKNKGRDAADACLGLISISQDFERRP